MRGSMKGNLRIKSIIISSIFILIFSIVIGSFVYYSAHKAIVANISESLIEIASLGAKAVENNLKSSLEVLETIAKAESIKNPNIPIEKKIEVLKSLAENKGFIRISIADKEGNSFTSDGISLYVGDREYFKLAIDGNRNISDPIESKINNKLVVTFAVPIIYNNEIVGVLYSTKDAEALSEITDVIKHGEYGGSYIIGSDGTIIAHKDRNLVIERINPFLDWENIKFEKSAYEFYLSAKQNEKGIVQYIFKGEKTYAGYAKIPDTSWYFGIAAPKSQIFNSLNRVYIFIGSLLLLIIVMIPYSQFLIRVLRRNLESEKNIAAAAIDTAGLIIIGIDKDGIIYDLNKHAEEKLGYSKADAAGNLMLKDIAAPEAMSSYNKLMDHITNGQSFNGFELALKNRVGEDIHIMWNLTPVPDYGYKYFEIVGMDISERIKNEKDLIKSQRELTLLNEELCLSQEALKEQYEELSEKDKEIQTLAYYDPLTGLSNRINLENYFMRSIQGKKSKAALLYMDLDNFKYVNDTFGHDVGDKLLIQVAENMKAVIKDENVVARLSGDEFMILAYDYNSINELQLFAEKLLKSFEFGFHLGDSFVNISASMGIAQYPDNGHTFGELMKCSDTALYAAKEAGKGIYVFFRQDMYDNIAKRMNIQSGIIKAMNNNEFIVYYQPKYELKTKRVKGYEALIRWKSPELGFIPPIDIIGIAESSGLIVPLGEWVLKEACDFIKHIIDMGHKDISVSVNVSAIQLVQEDFVPMVARVLKEKDLEPSNLELEITESILIENIYLNLKKIKKLKKLGVKISLDDFGKGYSSLTYLRELPINTLKIDKSFIDNIMYSENKTCLTGTIIMLAHDLGIGVVAEGVEKEEQLKYLEKYNCDMVQGYIFSKPLPKEEAVELIMG